MQHHDHISLTNRGEAMGNKEDGLIIEILEQIVADLAFSFVIEGAGRFIHHQQLGVTQQRARNGNPLALTATEGSPRSPTGVL